MEGIIQLSYSIDSGANWKTPTTYSASSNDLYATMCFPYLQPEPDSDEQPEGLTDAEICYTGKVRIHLQFTLRGNQFDQTTANGQALLKFIGALRGAPLIRLYRNSANINGFTEFASASNTNYLVPHDTPPFAIPSVGEKTVEVAFTLKAKKEFTI